MPTLTNPEWTLLTLLIGTFIFSLVRTQLHREHLHRLSKTNEQQQQTIGSLTLDVNSLIDGLAASQTHGGGLEWDDYRRARARNSSDLHPLPRR